MKKIEFFKLTKEKIIIWIIISIISFFTQAYSLIRVSCMNPPCKNVFIEIFGEIFNYIPIKIFELIMLIEYPFPLDILMFIIGIIIIPVAWAYLLSCLIIFIYKKIKKKK